MSTTRSSNATRVPPRVWAFYAAALALLLLFFALIAQFAKVGKSKEEFKVPDDVQAARELLTQKFTGPQYFQIGEEKGLLPYPCISVTDARSQMDRIIKERKLTPEVAIQINKLIEKLTVPEPSRMVGVDHVNILQLNLALDKLR
ncbi:potassium-transporting ATPase subunit C [Prosthecobacter sp.]|uniref:potassium-transporting ATPase subunit C n=1 Tax=Prosthecobacter sp. TaxID=1965333 RepID=UPI002ABB12D6|nr:potassium-transporting ATPase subunit C [Prosthecobacter sp.]MDZ4401846.1 potassium-transporting ATPase subunit C [Prosthecobacter sp.]